MRCYLTNAESRSFFDAYLILHDPCVIQIFSWRNSHQSSTLSTLDFILTEYWSRGMTKGENILRGFQKHIDIHWQVGILQINKTLDIYIDWHLLFLHLSCTSFWPFDPIFSPAWTYALTSSCRGSLLWVTQQQILGQTSEKAHPV